MAKSNPKKETPTPVANKRRANVHPVLLRRIDRVLAAMETLGFPMVLTDGARTAEQQHMLFQQGRTRPGKKVTDADGYAVKSNHQIKADGFGHAVDCTFVDENGNPVWRDSDPWATYGACCKAVGLSWGGYWPKPDRPHVELPKVV